MRNATLSILAVLSLALVGCSGPKSAEAESSSPAPSPAFAAVGYPMPNLGPEPSMALLSDADAETQRLAYQDKRWLDVLSKYPDAARPVIAFTGYLADKDYVDVLYSCYTAAGVPSDLGTDANGLATGLSIELKTEAEEIAAFTCQQEHPSRPLAQADAHVLGWIYDYLTQFLAPCYAANGIQNPAPPTRDYFIANWPNQNWWPSQGGMPMGTPEDEAIGAACPLPK